MNRVPVHLLLHGDGNTDLWRRLHALLREGVRRGLVLDYSMGNAEQIDPKGGNHG